MRPAQTFNYSSRVSRMLVICQHHWRGGTALTYYRAPWPEHIVRGRRRGCRARPNPGFFEFPNVAHVHAARGRATLGFTVFGRFGGRARRAAPITAPSTIKIVTLSPRPPIDFDRHLRDHTHTHTHTHLRKTNAQFCPLRFVCTNGFGRTGNQSQATAVPR